MGNMLDPIYRHMKKIELVVSPIDQRGNKVASHFHPIFKNVPEKLKPLDY